MSSTNRGYCLGIDIGGTFTDAYLVDLESGESFQGKVPTTPEDLVTGIISSVEELSRITGKSVEHLLSNCVKLVHATTQSTNLVFTRTGAKVGLVTTAGFEDTLAIMRAIGRVAGLTIAERQHYAQTDKPAPIVPASLIEPVHERVDYSGKVLVPLDQGEARAKIGRLLGKNVESIAICLLWSFKNSTHEKMLEDLAKELAPGMFVSASSRHFGIMGEYERTATTVLNAYVGPLMAKYLDRVEMSLSKLGLACRVLIATSQGGVLNPSSALEIPVATIESGPASGITGSKYFADRLGLTNVIVTDVGGTTFKVGVIEDGTPKTVQTSTVTQFSINNPMLEIFSIGSGGGSIAWLDGGSRLRVGPKSAQAVPGPACYGRGGEDPTVTDADVVLGFISPENFLGGRMKLDRSLARKAIKEKIADEVFGGDIVEAASGIREIVDEQMADLIRKGTMQRGIDVRRFSLMAYGGAGPAHVGQYSMEIPVREIIIPFFATVHSAFGAVVSKVVHVKESSSPMTLGLPDKLEAGAREKIEALFQGMKSEALLELESEGFSEKKSDRKPVEFRRFLYLKYGRQVHTLLVPMEETSTLRDVVERFEEIYEQKYSRDSMYKEAGIELVSLRLEAVGNLLVPELKKHPEISPSDSTSKMGEREVYWGKKLGFESTPIYSGLKIQSGTLIEGPAIIEHYGTTIVIHHGQNARIDGYLNTIITTR